MAGRQSPALGQVLCPCQQTAPRERPAQPLAGPVVRGRLPGLDGGIGGASRRYLSSLSACLAPTSPTKARLSGIHIATSRNAMPPPESASRALGTTPQATHPDLLKRALRPAGVLSSGPRTTILLESLPPWPHRRPSSAIAHRLASSLPKPLQDGALRRSVRAVIAALPALVTGQTQVRQRLRSWTLS